MSEETIIGPGDPCPNCGKDYGQHAWHCAVSLQHKAMKPTEPCANTDRELWRKIPGDAYSPSIHVTASGAIGINVGGHVIVSPIERWHEAMTMMGNTSNREFPQKE